MRITIRSFAMIREALGSKDTSIEIEAGSKVSNAISLIADEFPKAKVFLYENTRIRSNLLIMVNEDKIDPIDYSTFALKENDNLIIIPPSGGG